MANDQRHALKNAKCHSRRQRNLLIFISEKK